MKILVPGAALALLLVALVATGTGDREGAAAPPVPALQRDTLPDHEQFSQVLGGVVRDDRVDYGELQRWQHSLSAYLEALARTSPTALEEATRDEALAFWINAYNACMLGLVAAHYPIEPGETGLAGAIRNRLAGYPDDSVWQIPDAFTRQHCTVAGSPRSQDEIEHEIIRPRFEEPRIHFAVNCAAVSCPVLWPEAYVGHRLDEQLERAVRRLVDDPEHFRIEGGTPPVLRVNRVMDWYSDDFGGTEGLKRFFAEYVDEPRRDVLLQSETRVEFFDYDWSLNDVEG